MIDNNVNNGFQSKPLPAAKSAAGSVVDDQAKVSLPSEDRQVEAPTENLESAVSKLNDYVQNISRTLSFSIDDSIGQTVIAVYDSETEELIRQIPAEETIKMAHSIEEQLSTLLLNERA
jgi:flagellar protein FlaG